MCELEKYVYLGVLIIFMGAFIFKCGEAFVALLGVIKWLAVPILIVAAIWFLGGAGHWFLGA
jgi:hypothetical protein